MSSGHCLSCHNDCRTCSGENQTQCLSCHNNAHLLNNSCVILLQKKGDDELSVQAMKLIIGLTVSTCGLACLITVVYKLCKKDPFFEEIEKEVKEEENRRRSLINEFPSNGTMSLVSNQQISDDNPSNENAPNYAGLTIVINNKVSNFKKTKETDKKTEEEIQKNPEDSESVNPLATIKESHDDEEKSSILIKN